MPSGKKRKRHKVATHKRKKRRRLNRHKKKKQSSVGKHKNIVGVFIFENGADYIFVYLVKEKVLLESQKNEERVNYIL